MDSLWFEVFEVGGGTVIGFSLGVLAMAFVRGSNEDKLRTPVACPYPHGDCLVAQQPGKAF